MKNLKNLCDSLVVDFIDLIDEKKKTGINFSEIRKEISLSVLNVLKTFQIHDSELPLLFLVLGYNTSPKFKDFLKSKELLEIDGGLRISSLIYLLNKIEVQNITASDLPKMNLFRNGLIALIEGKFTTSTVFLHREIALYPTFLNFLIDICEVHPRIKSFADFFAPDIAFEDIALDSEMEQMIYQIAKEIPFACGALPPMFSNNILHIRGESGSGRRTICKLIALASKKNILFLYGSILSDLPKRELSEILDMAILDAKILNAICVMENGESLFNKVSFNDFVLRKFEKNSSIYFIIISNSSEEISSVIYEHAYRTIALKRPSAFTKALIWEKHIPVDLVFSGEINIEELSSKYALSPARTRNAMKQIILKQRSGAKQGITQNDLENTASEQLLTEFPLFNIVRSHYTLNDLILPEGTKSEIMEIISAGKHRYRVLEEWQIGNKISKSQSLCVLFEGEPGTGKTLAAEIIARELNLPLLQVNVSSLVSKWVGETEKNIINAFYQAQAMGGLLLFDEADALFSMRLHIETSMDKFANLSIDTLLQAIERYNGIVILTTNFVKNIDPAFNRRINYRVSFPFPDANTRKNLWQYLMPEHAPLDDDIDFEKLGRNFELSGGHIKNVILRTCYICASNNETISMKRIIEMAEKESIAAGRLFRKI